MDEHETPLDAVIRGALAGIVGAAVIGYVMRKSAEMMQPAEGPKPAGAGAEDPRGKLVRKVSSSIFEVELPEEERGKWAEALHWAYGSWWGVVYGIVQGSCRLPWWFHGTLLGTIVWAFGPAFMLPRMKLSPPPEDQPSGQLAMSWVFHQAYGLATALSHALLSRL